MHFHHSLLLVLSSTRTVTIGEEIRQNQGNNVTAKGYVASFDSETKILKYYQDRSLCFGNKLDQVRIVIHQVLLHLILLTSVLLNLEECHKLILLYREV